MVNKKAQVTYLLYGMAIIIVTAFLGVIGYNVHTEFNDNIQADVTIPNISKNMSAELNTDLNYTFDTFTLVALLGIIIGSLVISYLFPMNPIAMGVVFILLLSLTVIPAALSNVWESFISDISLVSMRSLFPVTDFIMKNYGMVFLVAFFLNAIVVLSRRNG